MAKFNLLQEIVYSIALGLLSLLLVLMGICYWGLTEILQLVRYVLQVPQFNGFTGKSTGAVIGLYIKKVDGVRVFLYNFPTSFIKYTNNLETVKGNTQKQQPGNIYTKDRSQNGILEFFPSFTKEHTNSSKWVKLVGLGQEEFLALPAMPSNPELNCSSPVHPACLSGAGPARPGIHYSYSSVISSKMA